MEVEAYLSKSRLFQRLRSGPYGQLVERYAARLIEERLVRLGTWRCLNVVGGLLSWIASRRCVLTDLDEHVVERYLRYRGGQQSIQPGDRAALKRWLLVLREEGAIAPGTPQLLNPLAAAMSLLGQRTNPLPREKAARLQAVIREGSNSVD